MCVQDKDLSGLTAGFAAAGDAAAAAAGVVFSASAGFAIQLLTRPVTPPLIPATSWEKETSQTLNHKSVSVSMHLSFSLSLFHLVCRGWTFRGAAHVALLPHAFDAARASCWNICHGRFGGLGFFGSLWGKKGWIYLLF